MSDSLIHLMIVLGLASGVLPARAVNAPGADAAPAMIRSACGDGGGVVKSGSRDDPCAPRTSKVRGVASLPSVAVAAPSGSIATQSQR